jgi:IMP cyclohydrolase
MSATFVLPPYPGRGVIIGAGNDARPFWIYFLTGRSESSRRRTLSVRTSSVVVTAVDPEAPSDELRHYACLEASPSGVVVGNGAHVTTLAVALS